jgi:hypothetical protein
MNKTIRYFLWGFALVLLSVLLYPPVSKFVTTVSSESCTGLLVPHCGYDNATYANSCEFDFQQKNTGVQLYHYGTCGAQIRCLPTRISVCGLDNNTYPNECVAVRLANVGVFKQGVC